MDPFFHTGLSISDSLKTVRKSVLIYETIISFDKPPFSFLLFDSFMSRTVFATLNITYISLNVKLFLFLFYI